MKKRVTVIVGILAIAVLFSYTSISASVPEDEYTYKSVGAVDEAILPSYYVIDRYGTVSSMLCINLFSNAQAPTSFSTTANGTDIDLSWAIGANAIGVLIKRGDGAYPTTVDEGVEVYKGAATSYSDLGANSEGITYYYSAWGYNASGYSENYAMATGGGILTNTILLGILVFLSLSLTIGGFVLHRSSLAFVSMATWMITCVWGYLEASGVWGISMGIFWVSIAMILVSGIEGAMILTKAEEKAEEEAEYPEALEEALRDMDKDNKARRIRRREGR